MSDREGTENKIGFIVGRHRNNEGMYVTEVNMDAIKSKANDYHQNLKETISIYHEVVANGIQNIDSQEFSSSENDSD